MAALFRLGSSGRVSPAGTSDMSCDAASAQARRQHAPDPQFDTKLLAKRFPLCTRIYLDMALTEREHARITALLSHGMAWWSETEWLRGSQKRALARTKI